MSEYAGSSTDERTRRCASLRVGDALSTHAHLHLEDQRAPVSASCARHVGFRRFPIDGLTVELPRNGFVQSALSVSSTPHSLPAPPPRIWMGRPICCSPSG